MLFFIDDSKRGKLIKKEKVNLLEREFNGHIINDDCNWLDGEHSLDAPRLLTNEDSKYFLKNAIFKAELYPPQATLLYAMIQLENNQKMTIKVANNTNQLHTRIGRLSEKFSFGKTVLALALICAQKFPLDKTSFYNLPCDYTAAAIPEINIHYHKILPFTVVAAAASIISQWEENIIKFTNLKYFIIDNVFSLIKFEKNYMNSNIDVVLIKVGKVTKTFKSINEIEKNTKNNKIRSLFDAFISVIGEAKIARFIIDDFDVIKLSSSDYLIPASFTWLISATRRQTTVRHNIIETKTVVEFLQKNMFSPILNYAHDNILNKTLSIHCDPNYVDLYIQSTKIHFRQIVVKGGNAINLLQKLEVPAEVIEMINGDAISTAAQTLGLEVCTISDLLKAVIGQHLNSLNVAKKTIKRANMLHNKLFDTKLIKDIIKKNTDQEFEEFLLNCIHTDNHTDNSIYALTIKNIIDTAENAKLKALIPLNRLKDNIHEGYCQCCSLPFNEDEELETDNFDNQTDFDNFENQPNFENQYNQPNNQPNQTEQINQAKPQRLPAKTGVKTGGIYILSNCCQIVICESCITKNVNNKKQFIKRCPNCAQDIHLNGKGLIKVGDKINLEEFSTSDDNLMSENDDNFTSKNDNDNEIPIPKLKALINLLKNVNNNNIDNTTIISDNYVDPFITGLLIGSRDVPFVEEVNANAINITKKILIFSMMTETTQLLNKELTKFGINNLVLHGTRNQKDITIAKFAAVSVTAPNILLVTSAKDCAGLHLPFVTHIIFYHKIIDKNIEAQVAARGQRLGRTCNLEIIQLLNKNE